MVKWMTTNLGEISSAMLVTTRASLGTPAR